MTGPSPDVAATMEAAQAWLATWLRDWVRQHGGTHKRDECGALRLHCDCGAYLGVSYGPRDNPRDADEREALAYFRHQAADLAAALAETPRPAEPEQDDRLVNVALSVWSNTCNAHCSEEDRRHGPDCLLAADLYQMLAARRAPQPERAARDHGLRERVEALASDWERLADCAISVDTIEWLTAASKSLRAVLADDAADTDSEAGQ